MNKEIIREYWLIALLDFDEGASMKEMKKTLKMYEKIEMYEACAGILKAIKQIEYERNNKKVNRS